MYYVNEFIYYYMKSGEKNYFNYTGIRLYKSRQEALNNAEREWLELSNDIDILTEIRAKAMYIWNDKEEQASNMGK